MLVISGNLPVIIGFTATLFKTGDFLNLTHFSAQQIYQNSSF
jgi:hypothetical protein